MTAAAHYIAKTGMVTISTANSNLDGTGALGTVITAASNGTLIKNVFIKAVDIGSASTTQGMVRFFIDDTNAVRLLQEIEIPSMGQSSNDQTFEITIPLDFMLEPGCILKASTQNAETFNVIAESLDVVYCRSSVRPGSIKYTTRTRLGDIKIQNSNLDGSGTLETLVTAGRAASGWEGLAINSINLKVYTDGIEGMLRLYVQNASTGAANTFLFKEIRLNPATASATSPGNPKIIELDLPETLQADFKIVVSIESTDGVDAAAEIDSVDWTYSS